MNRLLRLILLAAAFLGLTSFAPRAHAGQLLDLNDPAISAAAAQLGANYSPSFPLTATNDDVVGANLFIQTVRSRAMLSRSGVVVWYPKGSTIVSQQPMLGSPTFEASALPSRWLLTLQSKDGGLITYALDLSEGIRMISRQSHPIYFDSPDRIVWVAR